MFGLRYHIVTVVSMLLMLGIGFLFGATSSFGPGIVKAQTKTLTKLSGTLTDIQQENERDRNLLRQNQDAITELTPGLVGSKLARKRIAIVQLGDYPDAAQAAAQAVAVAGGKVVSTMTVDNRLGLLDDAKRQQLAGPNEDVGTLYHCLAVAFRAGTVSRPDAQTGLDALQNSDIISYSGDYSQPVSGVIVIGGWSDDPTESAENSAAPPGDTAPLDNADNEVGLIGALDQGGSSPLVVVGCETSDAAYSSIPDYLKANVASVDCIDLPVGALDLPFALAGEHGAYGIKSQSSLLLPRSIGGGSAAAESGG